MRPLAVHHVSINIEDLDAAIDFYVDVLGLRVRDDRPDLRVDGAWLDVGGGQQVHLIRSEVPAGKGQHFALLVDDIGEAVRELRDRDVQVSDPSPIGTSLQSFLSDPSGNLIELHQAGATPP